MKILITAGPTREWLDPVRFLSNPATGRLGYLLAADARRRGAEVFLVSGPTELPAPDGVKFFPVETAVQMDQAVRKLFPGMDCLIMTAAVGDWRPRFRKEKVKCKRKFSVTFFPNPDILEACGRLKRPGQVLIGCGLETRALIKAAKQKIKSKNLDYILMNDPLFFGQEKGRHSSLLVSRRGEICDLSARSKEDISQFLLEHCLTTICSNPS